MTASEKIDMLKEQIEKIKEEYCENCQESDCDYCWARMDGGEDG